MSGFCGKAFVLGIEHLDAASRELFYRHGKAPDGRWALVEQIVDDAMVRLLGPELHWDPHESDRHL